MDKPIRPMSPFRWASLCITFPRFSCLNSSSLRSGENVDCSIFLAVSGYSVVPRQASAGPEIRFGMGPFKMSFPTRMTLIRLPGGKLVVHSPTALTPDLAQEVNALGEVADIVAPNKIHYWWMRDWAEAYPKARILAAPDVKERAGDRLPVGAFELDGASVDGWGETLSYLPVTGR